VGENDGWKRRRWYEGHPELFEVVETIGDLINRNSMEVLARPGCGRKTLNELRDGLRAMNLHFRNEVRP
jgi:DNA-directed RNA polymerase alpha subunit